MKKESSQLYSWGLNKKGNLGIGNIEEQSVPQLIAGVPNTIQVSCGGFSTFAVTTDGAVYVCGSNGEGRLGNKKTDDVTLKMIKISLSVPIKFVAAGDWHTVAIDISGNAYATGYNKHGALGILSPTGITEFTPVKNPKPFAFIRAGCNISMALTLDGEAYSTGDSLLHGNKDPKDQFQFTIIAGISKCTYIDAGFASCGCVADGKLFMWGDNKSYQLGTGNNVPHKVPIQISIPGKVTQVSNSRGTKYPFAGCLTEDGFLYTWGSAYKGKLGHSEKWSHAEKEYVKVPTKVDLEYKPKLLIAGGIHCALIDDKDQLRTWGCGSNGRMGHPESDKHTYLYKEAKPRVIEALKGAVISASSSYYHMAAVVSKS
jgi:alpha-tubulin suppressor-like RCC1 family protein